MKDRITRNPAEVMRDEMAIRDRVLEILSDEPLTIPDLADKLGYPVYEAVKWVMAMWSYKLVEETGKADPEGYFKYRVKESPEGEE